MTETGTGALTHLDDSTGDLFEQFGALDRSTFLFVQEDGTFVRTGFGLMDAERLASEIDQLIGVG